MFKRNNDIAVLYFPLCNIILSNEPLTSKNYVCVLSIVYLYINTNNDTRPQLHLSQPQLYFSALQLENEVLMRYDYTHCKKLRPHT